MSTIMSRFNMLLSMLAAMSNVGEGKTELQADVSEVELHVKTPLIFSAPLSRVANRPVYLKLENTQPSGSFKLRG